MSIPTWLEAMYATTFFEFCQSHSTQKLDYFCSDCLCALCSTCLSQTHSPHKCFKIRRYLNTEVINRQDLCKHFNCSGIQSYSTNRAKVIFLNRRIQQQQQHISSRAHQCLTCQRVLPDPTLYCCIACKVSTIKGEIPKEATSHGDCCDNTSEVKEEESLGSNRSEDESSVGSLKLKIKPRQCKRKGTPFRAPMV